MSTAKMFVPASLIIALATVVFGVQPSVAEPAADECKTTPGSSAPPGQHWYYRVNRSDQRHCWYLGAESTKVRLSPPAVRSVSLSPFSPSPAPGVSAGGTAAGT